MLHVLCVFVIGFLCTDAHPEEVLWLLAFVDDLQEELISQALICFTFLRPHLYYLFAVGGIKHGVQYVFCQLGFVRV